MRFKERFAEYRKRFIKEDEGSELLQWSIIIVIVVSLVAIVWGIVEVVKSQLQDTKTQLENMGSSMGGTTAAPSTAPTGLTPP